MTNQIDTLKDDELLAGLTSNLKLERKGHAECLAYLSAVDRIISTKAEHEFPQRTDPGSKRHQMMRTIGGWWGRVDTLKKMALEPVSRNLFSPATRFF